MHVVRIIGFILLAVFLTFNGLISLLGLTVGHFIVSALGLISLGAGVLLLISLGSSHKDNCK